MNVDLGIAIVGTLVPPNVSQFGAFVSEFTTFLALTCFGKRGADGQFLMKMWEGILTVRWTLWRI